MFSQTSLI